MKVRSFNTLFVTILLLFFNTSCINSNYTDNVRSNNIKEQLIKTEVDGNLIDTFYFYLDLPFKVKEVALAKFEIVKDVNCYPKEIIIREINDSIIYQCNTCFIIDEERMVIDSFRHIDYSVCKLNLETDFHANVFMEIVFIYEQDKLIAFKATDLGNQTTRLFTKTFGELNSLDKYYLIEDYEQREKLSEN